MKLQGQTMLHHACRHGNVELVNILLGHRHNVDPSHVDDAGCTPLHHAALGGSEEVIKLLITEYCYPVNSKNNDIETPIHLACVGGHLNVVKVLVDDHSANFAQL